ncbi:hypothetical protein NQ317_014240 [Molorchus minor]|uniref:Uncharacterized protein n=1 Tax=Molorchus minor TaxID=1323400 RepID=A0ABQ9IZ75_9CUCU|nr:hypothetical protein NQ317_014240 [Molorchus minor]
MVNNMADKPKASSTPKIIDLSRRRPIGDCYKDIQSPITNDEPTKTKTKVYSPGTRRRLDKELNELRHIPESMFQDSQVYEQNEKLCSDSNDDADIFTQESSPRNSPIVHHHLRSKKYSQNTSPSTTKYAQSIFKESSCSYDETNPREEGHFGNRDFCNCLSPKILVFIIIAFISILCLYYYSGEEKNIGNGTCLEELTKKFPSQIEDFGLTVRVNLYEIVKFNRPKTFLFLYNDDSRTTTDAILSEISKCALSVLSNCNENPIQMHGHDLSSTAFVNDYGSIQTRLKGQLEKCGVMVVKNLEEIPGASAQVFHSLCDEYNPLVNKALFFVHHESG